jgi:competence protein ComEC
VQLSSHFKYAVIVTGTPDTVRVFLYFAVLIIWICVHIILMNKKIDAVCIALLVCVLTGLHYNINSDMKIAMLDVGQGDSIVMHTKEGMNVLFDGGSTSKKNVGRYTIYTYLKYCGVRSLDYVFISHPDKDHVNGIYELIELCDNTFEIGTVVLPGISRAAAVKKQADDDMSKLEKILKNAGINVVYADAGDCIKSGGFSVKCMHPCEGYDYESANDYSAVYLVEYGDFSMLMTGDAEKKAEKCIIEDVNRMAGDAGEPARLVSVNILKVGHHGSKGASSEEFLSYVKPETALISCGAGNSYGHPHTQTLQRLSGIGAKVYRTDESGEIAVRVRDGLYKIEVFKAL